MKKYASSTYLNPSTTYSKRSAVSGVKLFASMMIAVILGTFFLGSAVAAQQAKEAEAVDWTQWILCNVAPDPSKQLYQYSQTSDFWYEIRSKSTMNGDIAEVDQGLNWLLNLFGPGFKETNEKILGYDLEAIPNESDAETEKAFNGGTKVNVYDRFGVAGMSFSSYQGEWKYILVDACNPDADPKDPRAGLYYEERLEPRSTWEYVSSSPDPRTIQFDRGILVHYWTSIVNVVANALFWVTKVIVVVTISLIGLSLSDIVGMFGIDEFIGSEGGMFDTLFAGIFQPLVFLAFLATAFKLFWDAIVKRQYRTSLIGLLRSLFMFLMAFIIAANPSFWMSLPNNVAIVGQSVVLTTLSGNLPNSSGLCDTDIGSYKLGDGKSGTIEENVNLLTQASENMRSAVSCQFWQAFLFRPWAQGQFGTDWKMLWANDEIPKWSEKSESSDLRNLNGEMVGDAAVPIGDGEFINNWAIYHLSTQTNVHAATGEDNQGQKAKYTSGVSNDWWRIVDALSNYEEETKTADLVISSGVPGTGEVSVSGEYVFPIANASKSSNYGMRTHPVTGERKLHAGNDYSAPTGTPLYAVANGTISTSSSSTGGNIIELKGADGWTYRYLHLSGYSVSNGQTVQAGQEVGKVGATGRVTGAHLHFETVDPGGNKIDTNQRLTAMGFNPENGSGAGTAQGSAPSSGTTTTQPYEYGVPKNNPVTPYWDTWVGNNSFGRIWTSMSSILIALIGLSAPLVLASMAAVYSIGTALIMAFAPIFLLLGCWSGKGWEIFKGWAELVINTTLKRIIIGLLLALSMSFITTAIGIIDNVGWFQGMIVLLLLSILILNSRKKLVDMMANIRFAGADLSGTANRMSGVIQQQTIGRAKTASKDASRMTGSVVAGAVGSKRAGGTFKEGAAYGVKREIKNLTYRKQSLNHARITYENTRRLKGDISEEEKINNGLVQCASCGENIEFDMNSNGTGIFRGGRTIEGNLLCYDCQADGMRPGSDEVELVYLRKEEEELDKKEKERVEQLNRLALKGKSSFITEEKSLKIAGQQKERLENGSYFYKNGEPVLDKKQLVERRQKDLLGLANTVHFDIRDYKENLEKFKTQKDASAPASAKVPEFLKPYVNREDLLALAWVNEEYEFIESVYAAAVFVWYKEAVGGDLNMDWEEFFVAFKNKEVANRAPLNKQNTETTEKEKDSE